MKDDSRLSRLIFVSPWFLLIFLVIPVIDILSLSLHIQLPLAGSKPLLVNNICFALLVACRLLRYLTGLGKEMRYGAGYRLPRHDAAIARSVPEVRGVLKSAGYSFADGEVYGEKRDLGYLGTTVLYGGLLTLLAVGSWDNLRQFSGVLLDGIGPATRLNRTESYRSLNTGLLSSKPDSLPRMKIVNQFMPDSNYPRGATEVSLISEDGKEMSTILRPGFPINYGAYEIYMTKLVYEPEIVIKTRDSKILFDGLVMLDPLVQKRGDFSFYGLYVGADLVGGVYYQPEKSRLKVVITRGEKRVVTDMTFQVDQQMEQGDYILSCAKMGQWSEIHVVHRRHKNLMMVGGGIAIIGLLMRIAIRPRRVWLEEAGEGCRVRAVGGETKRLLKL
jgi:ResB-like family